MKKHFKPLPTAPPLGGQVRALFVSDLHLGSRYCQPAALDCLLKQVRAERVYLIGDFFDAWLIARKSIDIQEFHEIARTVQTLVATGAEVHYVLGNHDRALQPMLEHWNLTSVGESRIHVCQDQRRLLVVHGDQFDVMQRQFPRSAKFAANLHECLLGCSDYLNRRRQTRAIRRRPYGTLATVPFKRFMQSYSRFENNLFRAIADSQCDGVVSGHTHTPRLREKKRGIIANTGDWLENCTAIIERESGQLELWGGQPREWLSQTPRRLALVPPRYDSPLQTSPAMPLPETLQA